MFPLLAGLGVASFVEAHTGRNCRIKWPNDVLADGRKVSGILCEARGERLYVGIGINCRQETFPPMGKLSAVSLRQLGWLDAEPLEILGGVLACLRKAFESDAPVRQVNSRLLLRAHQVTVATGLPERSCLVQGRLLGLGPEGQVLIRENGTGCDREIYSGELVL